MKKLPNEIIVMDNPDKVWHESWTPGRNLLDIPHPYRCVCLGPPNSGKSLIVKNLLLRAKPEFDKLFVIHCDPDFTKEYNDVGGIMLTEIPAPNEWEGEGKTLVVLDDLEFKQMSKTQKRNLDRLFGFVSTHKNISIILCAQDPFNVPPIVRRCSNLFVLWKMPDLDSMSTVARKTGMKADDLKTIFKKFMKNPHDSLWVDITSKTPAKLRKNGYEIITK